MATEWPNAAFGQAFRPEPKSVLLAFHATRLRPSPPQAPTWAKEVTWANEATWAKKATWAKEAADGSGQNA